MAVKKVQPKAAPAPAAPLADPWEGIGGVSSAVPSPRRAPERADAPAAAGPGPGGAPEPPPAPAPAPVEPAEMYPPALPEVELRRTQERMSGGLAAIRPVTGIMAPVTDVEKAVKAWALFNNLKERLLTREDYYVIKGATARLVPTRTGWRKLALFFGLSADVVEEKRWQRGAVFGYDFMVRAVAPNGQMMVGVGSCDSEDLRRSTAGRLPITEHNVRAKAHTRAINRAISDLIGGGELSAEEVEGTEG